MNWVEPPPPASTHTPPPNAALVTLLEMSWPLLKLTFEFPDQGSWSNTARNPAPLGDAHVKLHTTADIAVGIVVDPKVPATLMLRCWPLPSGPSLGRAHST